MHRSSSINVIQLCYLWGLQVAKHVQGGWIQKFRNTSYKFPNSEKALRDAIQAAGPILGPRLLEMSEYLMASFNESYESRCAIMRLDFPTVNFGTILKVYLPE